MQCTVQALLHPARRCGAPCEASALTQRRLTISALAAGTWSLQLPAAGGGTGGGAGRSPPEADNATVARTNE